VESFALREKAGVEKHLAKKSAIQARLGMHSRRCFCLIPEAWVSSGAEPATSKHHTGCQLHPLRVWAELGWERALVAVGE